MKILILVNSEEQKRSVDIETVVVSPRNIQGKIADVVIFDEAIPDMYKYDAKRIVTAKNGQVLSVKYQ